MSEIALVIIALAALPFALAVLFAIVVAVILAGLCALDWFLNLPFWPHVIDSPDRITKP